MKTSIKRSVTAGILTLCMVLTMCTTALASVMYTGIGSIAADLSISPSGYASCYGYVINYNGYSSALKMELKRDGTTIKTWTTSGSGTVKLDKGYYVTTGHTYKVVVTASVRNSSGTVGIYTANSANVTY